MPAPGPVAFVAAQVPAGWTIAKVQGGSGAAVPLTSDATQWNGVDTGGTPLTVTVTGHGPPGSALTATVRSLAGTTTSSYPLS